jgi:hypothetical protein
LAVLATLAEANVERGAAVRVLEQVGHVEPRHLGNAQAGAQHHGQQRPVARILGGFEQWPVHAAGGACEEARQSLTR